MTDVTQDRGQGGARQALGHLGKHGEAHGDVEPVDQVLGVGVQVSGQVPDVVGAVGEEGDGLVGGHALGGQHLEQSPFGPVVVGGAYDSAARVGELLGLGLTDLDLDAKTAVVAGKGGIPRQVNRYTHTAHLLARLTSGRTDGPLFLAGRRPRARVATTDRDPATGRARPSYRRSAERFTDTTGWTLHQLRHTRIRELKDQGCPLPVLQKITGHRSLRTLTEHTPDPPPKRYEPGTAKATRPPGAATAPQAEPCLPRFSRSPGTRRRMARSWIRRHGVRRPGAAVPLRGLLAKYNERDYRHVPGSVPDTAGRLCRTNGRFPYIGMTGGLVRIIASGDGCADRY
jgi:Phage integrase family